MAYTKDPKYLCSISIKVTPQERDQLREYCEKTGVTQSEYFRFLLRVHQLFIPFQENIPLINPSNKIEDEEIKEKLSSLASKKTRQKK